MFLSSYGREFDFAAALSLARTQLVNFKKYGMDKRSGLNYHGYELSEDKGVGSYPVEKKGLVGWGRAAGWLMMGLSEYLNCTDRKDTELAHWYNELADLIFSYAKPEGGFSWLLPAVEGHLDTSATGMLIYGIRDAYSIEDLTPGIEALLAHTNDAGVVSSALSSCDDFAVHYQVYGDYPWGQGAALLAASVY
jgi:rhamnogalacturonyl hydrolase YesR